MPRPSHSTAQLVVLAALSEYEARLSTYLQMPGTAPVPNNTVWGAWICYQVPVSANPHILHRCCCGFSTAAILWLSLSSSELIYM